VIELKDVTKKYLSQSSSVEALRGVTLRVERGEYVALVGPSGSGKSSLLNLMGLLDVATSGEYRLESRDVSKLSDNARSGLRATSIGFVFQAFHLLRDRSIAENVALPLEYAGVDKKTRRVKAVKSLERVGLGGRWSAFPTELSGGEQQRVAIARALVNEPSLLLADEPTGNLDSATGALVMDIFDTLHRSGQTLMVVTHDMSVAGRAQRTIRLRDGRVEAST
jgi:putative ABC transport system ATP-binding protein